MLHICKTSDSTCQLHDLLAEIPVLILNISWCKKCQSLEEEIDTMVSTLDRLLEGPVEENPKIPSDLELKNE